MELHHSKEESSQRIPNMIDIIWGGWVTDIMEVVFKIILIRIL